MEFDVSPLVPSELSESLTLPAVTGGASGGLVWLLVAVAAAFVLGLVGLVLVRRRLRANGRVGGGLIAYVVLGPLVLGMALGAWAGFGFGAARGTALGIEQALGSLGANELAGVLMRAEQLVIAAGVSSDALEVDVLSQVIDPHLDKLRAREAALAGTDLGARLPLLVERVALEAAIGYAKREVGARLSWRTLVDRASGPALERLNTTTHTLLAPIRHAGTPLIIGWAVLLLAAHGVAWWRSGQRDTAAGAASVPV